MTRTAILLGLIVALSGTSYAQENNFNDSTANWESPWEQQLRWNRFLLKPGENEAPKFQLGKTQPIDRVDPGMAVIVPSTDDATQFPIKVIPEDFPSNMPVAKRPDSAPFGEAVKPKVTVVPRNTPPHP
jgi:hypothetical protein